MTNKSLNIYQNYQQYPPFITLSERKLKEFKKKFHLEEDWEYWPKLWIGCQEAKWEISDELDIIPNQIYFLEELSQLFQLNEQEKKSLLNKDRDLEQILSNREINNITKSIRKGKTSLLKILRNNES